MGHTSIRLQDDRNTPQAFSHFTYESSDHMVLVCDIQGVGDVYTDPQMHTLDGYVPRPE
jgi:elongation factor 2 kinase